MCGVTMIFYQTHAAILDCIKSLVFLSC